MTNMCWISEENSGDVGRSRWITVEPDPINSSNPPQPSQLHTSTPVTPSGRTFAHSHTRTLEHTMSAHDTTSAAPSPPRSPTSALEAPTAGTPTKKVNFDVAAATEAQAATASASAFASASMPIHFTPTENITTPGTCRHCAWVRAPHMRPCCVAKPPRLSHAATSSRAPLTPFPTHACAR